MMWRRFLLAESLSIYPTVIAIWKIATRMANGVYEIALGCESKFCPVLTAGMKSWILNRSSLYKFYFVPFTIIHCRNESALESDTNHALLILLFNEMAETKYFFSCCGWQFFILEGANPMLSYTAEILGSNVAVPKPTHQAWLSNKLWLYAGLPLRVIVL